MPFTHDASDAKILDMAVWTVRDHIEATAVRTSGTSDLTAQRRERLLGIVFDGAPLGEHGLGMDAHKEAWKRLDEMLALAHVLVGADVDYEVECITSLPPRHDIPMPDFEAVLRQGGRVRIELCRLSDKTEKQYVDALSEIGRRTEEAVAQRGSLDALLGSDTIIVRFYGGTPTSRDIAPAVAELTEIALNDVPRKRASTRLWPVGAEHPVLSRLGAHWARDTRRQAARIMMDPMRHIVRPDLEAAFDPMFEKKSKKAAQYSDGLPVWLALYGDTGMSFPLGAVDSLAGRENFDPHPFARVIVGCFTAGVVFEQGAPPRYASLSATG
jgi:hypothetical protein